MYKQLFVNGCSFNTPNPKGEVPSFVGKMVAKHFGLSLNNLARGGRGNDRIVVTTKLHFENFPDHKQNTIALIEWTQAGRIDYVTNDFYKPMKFQSTTWRTYHTRDVLGVMPGLDDVENESILMLKNILDLQTYFKTNNIKYIMYFGLNNVITETQDSKTLWNCVDTQHFFRPTYSHFQYCQDNRCYVSPTDYHPNTQGHRVWANELIKYMEDHDIRRT
jgi:hypothetical protein